jgi:hypothetical protein
MCAPNVDAAESVHRPAKTPYDGHGWSKSYRCRIQQKKYGSTNRSGAVVGLFHGRLLFFPFFVGQLCEPADERPRFFKAESPYVVDAFPRAEGRTNRHLCEAAPVKSPRQDSTSKSTCMLLFEAQKDQADTDSNPSSRF